MGTVSQPMTGLCDQARTSDEAGTAASGYFLQGQVLVLQGFEYASVPVIQTVVQANYLVHQDGFGHQKMNVLSTLVTLKRWHSDFGLSSIGICSSDC